MLMSDSVAICCTSGPPAYGLERKCPRIYSAVKFLPESLGRYGSCTAAGNSFVLPLDAGLAVWVDIDVQRHGVAADRAVLDIVLVRSG